MKNNFKNSILRFINKPEKNILSSQTLYELAFTNINMFSHSKDRKYLEQAKNDIEMIISTQLDDGGFDLGYDFIFGKGLSKTAKKEGTSPELLSLTALSIYKEVARCDSPRVMRAIENALKWIKDRILQVSPGVYAMPYAPDSLNRVHIINASSFTISAIACSIQHIDCPQMKDEFIKYLDGLFLFMDNQLEPSNEGAYWPYFYKKGDEQEQSLINDKIDNYHMAQQLYHHILASQYVDNTNNNI